MEKGRLEAFSDGVIAVIITIMVLELHPPHEATLAALAEVAHPFLAYVLSFIYIAIYWNNHHHMFQTVERVNGRVLWANNLLLFSLSLVPFVTNWVGESNFALWPMATYGVALFLPGFAYYFLATSLIRLHGPDSMLARAMGRGYKEWASLVLYVLGIAACFIHPYLGFALYGSVAVLWFLPDRRIERLVGGVRS
jgi:TMEM175 potassium channel family protein